MKSATRSKAHSRAALFTTLDRGMSLVARIVGRRNHHVYSGRSWNIHLYMMLLEREAKVGRLVREAVDRALIRAAQREGA